MRLSIFSIVKLSPKWKKAILQFQLNPTTDQHYIFAKMLLLCAVCNGCRDFYKRNNKTGAEAFYNEILNLTLKRIDVFLKNVGRLRGPADQGGQKSETSGKTLAKMVQRTIPFDESKIRGLMMSPNSYLNGHDVLQFIRKMNLYQLLLQEDVLNHLDRAYHGDFNKGKAPKTARQPCYR